MSCISLSCPLISLSQLPHSQALKRVGRRWGIEHCFINRIGFHKRQVVPTTNLPRNAGIRGLGTNIAQKGMSSSFRHAMQEENSYISVSEMKRDGDGPSYMQARNYSVPLQRKQAVSRKRFQLFLRTENWEFACGTLHELSCGSSDRGRKCFSLTVLSKRRCGQCFVFLMHLIGIGIGISSNAVPYLLSTTRSIFYMFCTCIILLLGCVLRKSVGFPGLLAPQSRLQFC